MGFCTKCGEIIRGDKCPCGGQSGATLSGMDPLDNVGAKYSDAYLSSGLNAGIETGLKRMLNISDQAISEVCVECSRTMTRAEDVFVAPYEAGKNEGLAYCEACYTANFSRGNCPICSQPILGRGQQWIKSNGKIFHRNCFESSGEATKCRNCQQTIVGQAVTVDGLGSWHVNCFNCEACGSKISEGSLTVRSDRAICSSCANNPTAAFDKLKSSASSNGNAALAGRTGGSQPAGNGNVIRSGPTDDEIARRDANNQAATQRQRELEMIKRGLDPATGQPLDDSLSGNGNGSNYGSGGNGNGNGGFNGGDSGNEQGARMVANAEGKACAKCRQSIDGSGVYVKESQIYHDECFACGLCSRPFDDLRFLSINGNAYHRQCFVNGKKDLCGKCQKPMSGKYVTLKDVKYHSDCFRCCSCSKPLAGIPFGESPQGPKCDGCFRQQMNISEKTISVHTTAFRSGFTINPITGAKEERIAGGTQKVTTSVAPKLGGADVCPRCSKAVYMNDKALGPMATNWHKSCLKCNTCNKALDSFAIVEGGNAPYCRTCHGKR